MFTVWLKWTELITFKKVILDVFTVTCDMVGELESVSASNTREVMFDLNVHLAIESIDHIGSLRILLPISIATCFYVCYTCIGIVHTYYTRICITPAY